MRVYILFDDFHCYSTRVMGLDQIKHYDGSGIYIFTFFTLVVLEFHNFMWRYQEQMGAVMVKIVRKLDWQLPVQSMPINTKVMSLNPAHDEVYSIQLYVIKFVSDLLKFSGFLLVLLLRFPRPIKLNVTI